jgi:hypothetical protein
MPGAYNIGRFKRQFLLPANANPMLLTAVTPHKPPIRDLEPWSGRAFMDHFCDNCGEALPSLGGRRQAWVGMGLSSPGRKTLYKSSSQSSNQGAAIERSPFMDPFVDKPLFARFPALSSRRLTLALLQLFHNPNGKHSASIVFHAKDAANSPLQKRVRRSSLTARDTLSFPLFGICHWKRTSRYVAQEEK